MNIKFISKNLVASTLALGLFIGANTIPSFAQIAEIEPETREVGHDIELYDMDIARGTYTGTQFFARYKLSSSNGKNVNFYVKNTGKVAVKITINGSHAATIQPGKQGHITAPVGLFSKNYEFIAAPTPNGGQISVIYGIAQRNN